MLNVETKVSMSMAMSNNNNDNNDNNLILIWGGRYPCPYNAREAVV